ncbi:Selenocysteine lyase/Cysteine desulfurase [Paramicrobacterium humi]|uniref:Selenocysteine lyase/Cysteine desulfurase n=1 Tax=Paramicrobacterium humi TaxID=640635 RepID=A0A1H4IMA2_9MICO|nr:aminotransferase class V-fold PLP-dependent enzyme [Microbacterium humi]SEB35199.1 Selenocysteine lyase/Cysteine desulfurase [Microbacterium humi]
MATIDGFRAGFLEEPGYLDFAAVGPVSQTVVEELRAAYDGLSRMRFGARARIMTNGDRLAQAVAALTGFEPENVTAQPNTSMGLVQAIFGLRGRLLLSRGEFPSMTVAAVRSTQLRRELELSWLDGVDGRVTAGDIAQSLTDDVSAVVVALVDPRTGYRADLTAIREAIGDRLLIVDGIQGVGAVTADFTAADVIATGGHKWLRAGWGTGFLAFSDWALERIDPVVSGFTGTEEYEPWGHVPDPARGTIGAFTVSGPDYVAEARLAAALEEVGQTGQATIEAAILDRVGELIELFDASGLEVVSPRERAEQSGIVVVDPGEGGAARLGAALYNTGVTATTRQGRVRFSVHAGTDDATIRMLRQALLVYRTPDDN